MASRHRRMNVKSKSTSSKVTNGSALFLPGVDGRSALARRTRDIFDAICRDLGGHDVLSEAQTQLVRRATWLSIECEQMEAAGVQGERIDLELFGKMTDRLGRTLQRLGLKRIARDVTPTVEEYLAAVNAEGSG
jgi:hypothetical protein